MDADWQLNVRDYMARFRVCLRHMFVFFSSHDELAAEQLKEILWYEDHHFGQVILNVIAGEGNQRVVHAESLQTTKKRFMQHGFLPMPFPKDVLEKVGDMMSDCPKNCGMRLEEKAALVLDWKNHTLMFTARWGCSKLTSKPLSNKA